MIGLPSLGGRFVVVAASAALHAGMFAAFGGHASAASNAEITVVSVETEVQTVPIEAPVEEPPIARNESAPASIAHTHTHPYPVPASHDAHPHDPSLVHALGPATPEDHDHDHDTPAPAAEVVTAPAAPAAAPARFVMSFGSATVSHGGETSGAGVGNGGGGDTSVGAGGAAPVPESTVAVGAKLVRGFTPPYPPDARANEIEADVPLEIVVDTNGNVTDARVAQHAGYGFDEAALKAIRAFRFSPAERDGHPVRVRMKWSVVFRLK